MSPSQVTFCTYDAKSVGSPESSEKPCPPHVRRHASMPSAVVVVTTALRPAERACSSGRASKLPAARERSNALYAPQRLCPMARTTYDAAMSGSSVAAVFS